MIFALALNDIFLVRELACEDWLPPALYYLTQANCNPTVQTRQAVYRYFNRKYNIG